MKTSTIVLLAAGGLGLYLLTRRGSLPTMDPDLWAVSLWGQSGLSEQTQWFYQQFIGQGYEPTAAQRAAEVAAVAERVNDSVGWDNDRFRSL